MTVITDKTLEKTDTKMIFQKEVSLGEIGILRITPNLQKIIDYLHYKIGSVEWSGILFYRLSKGDIKNLKNLEFVADFLYPMNIGNSTYTEFDYNGEVMNAYDLFPEGIDQSTGLIHSHQSMSCFFSDTDTRELKDNAGHYNFYLSLIVNFAHTYCAKIALPSKTSVDYVYSMRDSEGKIFKKKSQKEENTLLLGDLKVIIEGEVESPLWLENRVKELEVKKASIPIVSNFTPKVYGELGFNDLQDNFQLTRENNFQSNFQRDWKTQPMSKVPDKPVQNMSAKFLSALVCLNATKTDANIYQTFQELNLLAEDELSQFESSLDEKLEIIHSCIYGSEVDLRKHCLEGLLELCDYENIFGETPIYGIMHDILNSYV